MPECLGINTIEVVGDCSGDLLMLEVSYDGGNMYQNAGSGPWFYENSLQSDGEIKFKATIRKIGCADQYIYESFYPDVECGIAGFWLKWDIEVGDEIIIPADPINYSYDYNINWDDGLYETNLIDDASHAYGYSGSYVTKISGTFPRINFLQGGYTQVMRDKLLEIVKWGNIEWEAFNAAFAACTNLTVTATDTPNLSNVTSLASMFNGCSSITTIPNINNWDMAFITNINGMFISTPFNSNIGDWNTSNIESIESTFAYSSFNNGGSDSIKYWDTSKVSSMAVAFSNNSSFNQPLTNWNTSQCQDFSYMFYNASSFNQNLNNFNLASLTAGSSTSSRAESLAEMLSYSGLSAANYDAVLHTFATQSQIHNKSYINFGAEGLNYTVNGSGPRNYLINVKGWAITDAGQI